MNAAIEQMAHEVAAALFNGVYQGIALAGVLWLGLRLFRRSNAATRHAVTFVTLLAVAVLPVFHLASTVLDRKAAAKTAEPEHSLMTVEVAPEAANEITVPDLAIEDSKWPTGIFPGRTATDFAAPPIPAVQRLATPPLSETLAAPDLLVGLIIHADLTATEPVDQSIVAPTATQSESTKAALSPSRFQRPQIKYWQANLPGIASAVVVGLIALVGVARLLRLGMQFLALARLKRDSVTANDDLADAFSNVLGETPNHRFARLGVSGQVHAPMAIGYRKPMVLLPAHLAGAAEPHELEGVLRHELAHIQRRDDWFNLVQQLIAAACFFNPAVWWLSRRLTTDREIACDDHALAKSRSPQDYALLLTEFAGRSRGNDWIAAPAAWSSKSQLKERITMILDSKRNTSSRLARTSAGALTVATMATAAVALLAGPRLILAAPADRAPATGSSAASVYSIDTVPETDHEVPVLHADPFSSGASFSVSSDAKPKVSRNRSTITLRNNGATLTAPVMVETPMAVESAIETQVEVADIDVRPRVIIAHNPPPPEGPATVRPPQAPKPARSAVPTPAPDMEWHPAPPDQNRNSLERRLERLERQLERLSAEKEIHAEFSQDPFAGKPFVWKEKSKSKDGSDQSGEFHEEEVFFNHPNWPMNEEQQKVVEKAMKDAEAQIAQAMKEAERATRNAQQHAMIARERVTKRGPGMEQQRKMIEQQRRALEKQMENLDRQMEMLDQQMDRLDDQLDEQIEELEEIEENVNVNEDSHDNEQQPPQPGQKKQKF